MRWSDTVATLAWLGPWASDARRPSAPRRSTLRVPLGAGRTGQAWVYRPRRRIRRTVFVVGGVHYDGPTDPRLDRLCRIFANAGALVCAPFIDDYMQLRVTPRAVDDVRTVFDAFLADPGTPSDARPGLFSISFGALPALRIATDEGRADRVSEAVIFGGYRDFERAFRYALCGELDGVVVHDNDPLNRPVLFQTLLHLMDAAPSDEARLRRAWRRFAIRTWGRDAMKRDQEHEPVAHALIDEVHPDDVDLFLHGCGVGEGGASLCIDALDRMDTRWLDPVSRAGAIRCPVHVIHGRDDDVIPWSEAHSLQAALEPHTDVRVSITGLYGHTGAGGAPGPAEVAREVATMLGMVGTLAHLGTARPPQ